MSALHSVIQNRHASFHVSDIAHNPLPGDSSSGAEAAAHRLRKGTLRAFLPNTSKKVMLVAVALSLTACGADNTQSFSVAGTKLAADSVVGGRVSFSGKRADYSIVRNANSYTVTDNRGIDAAKSVAGDVQLLQFSDVNINLWMGGYASSVSASDLKTLIELYIAFFNRVPEADGLGYWINVFRSGQSIDRIADQFYDAAILYPNLTGYAATMTPAEFVRIIYKNVLGRSGDTAPPENDVQFWANRIANGVATKGSLIRSMLDSAHTFAGDSTWGWVATLLDNKYTAGYYFAVQQGINYNTPEASIQSGMAIAAAVTPETVTPALQLVPVNAGTTAVDPATPSPLPPASGTTTDARTLGQWSPLYSWPQVGVHLQLLPDGRVLTWSYRGDRHDDNDADKEVYSVDIPTGAPPKGWTLVRNPTTNLACSGFTLLSDGRMLVAGGEKGNGGVADTNIFDYRDNSWSKVGAMNAPRWYPTTTTLANGDVLVLGGLINFDTLEIDPLPQVWSNAGGWRNLTSAMLNVDVYPRMHLAPNGKVFKSGSEELSRYLDTSGTGAWSDVAYLNHKQNRDYGSSVMYDSGKVIVMGGGDPPTDTAEVIDLNDAAPAWKSVTPMKYARRHLNATIMADGKLLVTGGTSSAGFNDATKAALPAEMWDPTTGTWTTMATMHVPRVYHSTALLLPDGRILAAGGGDPAPVNGVDNVNAEIFSPPYLFAGSRPVIAQAPSAINYGSTFFVNTPDAADIVRATWIRLSSVTHAFNMNQRISYLTVKPGSGGVNITAPVDPNLAPPGHYMLFLINSKGVPSIAKTIQIL